MEEAEAQCRLLAAQRDDLVKRDAEREVQRKEELEKHKSLCNMATADAERLRKDCNALRESNAKLEESVKNAGRNKHEEGYQQVTRVAELQAELQKQATRRERSGDVDLLQVRSRVKLSMKDNRGWILTFT